MDIHHSIADTLTVEMMLSLKNFPKLNLLGGKAGLKRSIRNVTMLDSLDAFDWFQGNDLVPTTLYFVNESDFENIFRRSAQFNVAAIILFYPELANGVPKTVADLADQYGIPLLSADKSVRYTDVIIPVINAVEDRNNVVNRFYRYMSDLYSTEEDYNAFNHCVTLFGIANYRRYRLLFLSCKQDKKRIDQLQILNSLRNCIEKYYNDSVYQETEDGFWVTVPIQQSKAGRAYIDSFFHKDAVKETIILEKSFVSPEFQDMKQIRQIYSLSKTCQEINRGLTYKDNGVLWVEDMAYLCFLENASKHSVDIVEWSREFLKPIINYDEQNNTMLLQTLQGLLLGNKNSKDLALDLYIHPNTVTYRKKLIEKLLNLDSLERHCFKCTLAVTIYYLSQRSF